MSATGCSAASGTRWFDTAGRLLCAHVHSASVQDPDGAGPLLQASCRRFPFVQRTFACTGHREADATSVAVEIVRKPPDQVGLAVHPKRRVVERCFAWLGRRRRLAKDFEATIGFIGAFYASTATLLLRRLARCAGVKSGTLRLVRNFAGLGARLGQRPATP